MCHGPVKGKMKGIIMEPGHTPNTSHTEALSEPVQSDYNACATL